MPQAVPAHNPQRGLHQYPTRMQSIDGETRAGCGITAPFEHGLLQIFLSFYVVAAGVMAGTSMAAAFARLLSCWLDWLMHRVGRTVDLERGQQPLPEQGQWMCHWQRMFGRGARGHVTRVNTHHV
jgi:hypothetical protein